MNTVVSISGGNIREKVKWATGGQADIFSEELPMCSSVYGLCE